MKKILAFIVLFSFLFHFLFPLSRALETNGLSSPWTFEKAQHLAGRALIGATPQMIDSLYNAGSAQNAVNILFPNQNWPNRAQYLQQLENFKGDSFNVSDTNANRKAYAFAYYADPYEAKRKLFWLFEDIFPVDRDGASTTNINFPDIENHFKILYEESLWNYKKMIKRVLFDTQNPENSFAMWKYLDLLNGPNKDKPNENYARELMQLFLMLEHKPWEDAETPWAIRNYTEEDVAALALILTWFRYWEDKKVYFDETFHNTNTGIVFLSGALKTGVNFSFYDTASWSIDNTKITQSISGNNGLWDNIIDYIFAKREAEIAYFLAWRLLKYYVYDTPTQWEIEMFAEQIMSYNFELLPSIKWLLTSDIMYSDVSMNSIRYKNPIELMIWTLKQLHAKDESFQVDWLLNDASLLTTLDWTPYNPRSIFWREWFDHNEAFMNAYFHNQWVTYASKIAFTTGTWYYNLTHFIPKTYNTNTWIFDIKTSKANTFSWNISLWAFSLSTEPKILEIDSMQVQKTSLFLLDEENIFQDIDDVDQMIEADLKENNLLPQITELNDLSQQTSSWEIINSDMWEEKESSIMLPQENWEKSELETPISQETSNTGTEWEGTSSLWSQESSMTDEKSENTEENISENDSQNIPEVWESSENTIQEPMIESLDNQVWFFEHHFSSFIPKVYANDTQSWTLSFLSGTIVLPDFYIQTASWKINIEWQFDAQKWELKISSWSLISGKNTYNFFESTIQVLPWYEFHSDISIEEMLDQLEQNLYLWRKIPLWMREKLATFLQVNQNGWARDFLPNNVSYRNKYIRAVIAMLLSQPEFLLLSWYDKESSWISNSWNTQINDSSKKLIMIELYGWYDWINGVIPKNEYEYYSQIRWWMSYNKSDLLEFWDFYINKSFESFQSFYDSWDLRIVNKVWTPNHSRWHDTAAIQVASQKALQTVWTPGLIWEFIKNDTNPLNHIVLWTNRPAIYTNGNYINIWWSSILYRNTVWGTTNSEKEYQMSVLKNILNTREYPWDTVNNFKNSITLDAVGTSWQSSVWYTLATRLNFTKSLIDNGLGITYYVPGWGWYDTHGDQLKAGAYNLWDRTRDLAKDIAEFFTQMKNSWKDVTIIVYSEFWRTLKTNGTLWTDHGQWWGYFILSTNNSLKQNLPQKIMGKISLENEYNDWLWVGIDYRSIYSKILKSLYNVDVEKYFGQKFSLEEDLNIDIPIPSLLRKEYKETWWWNVGTELKFQVDDTNFRFKDGSYLRLKYGQNPESMTQFSKWTMDNYVYDEKTNSFNISLNLAKWKLYYYELEIVDNQYDKYIASGSFLVPEKYEANSTINTIPLTNDSFFAKYNNTEVDWEKKIDKLVLLNNPLQEIISTGTVLDEEWNEIEQILKTYTWWLKDVTFSENIVMTFGTGETFIDTLTSSWKWNWGFILPKFINKNEFISWNASWSGITLKNLNIENILKVWADSLWVGMKLNQTVKITLPVEDENGDYKIIKSEDGIHWEQILVSQSWKNITFDTSHFTYFAIYDSKKIIISPTEPENPQNPENPGSWWWSSGWGNTWGSGSSWWWSSWGWSSSWWGSVWWWWGGGWVSFPKDNCPSWDFSSSYYDGKCFDAIKTQTGTINQEIIKDKAYYQAMKNQILEDRKKLKTTNEVKIISTNIWNYTITEISWYKLSNKVKTISMWISANKKLSDNEKKKYIERLNAFLLARYQYEMQKTSQEMKNKYNKEMILLKSVIQKLKKL